MGGNVCFFQPRPCLQGSIMTTGPALRTQVRWFMAALTIEMLLKIVDLFELW